MKSLTLSNTFPYLLNFPSTNSNLVTYLALRVINGLGQADSAHFYLAHGHNVLGIMGY